MPRSAIGRDPSPALLIVDDSFLDLMAIDVKEQRALALAEPWETLLLP